MPHTVNHWQVRYNALTEIGLVNCMGFESQSVLYYRSHGYGV